MNISNKVIVITGGARGLGFSMASYLNKKGARIALIDLDQNSTSEAAKSLSDSKGYAADISNENDVAAVFEEIVADFGQIDVLVNNAGILQDGLLIKEKDGVIEKLPLSRWQSVIDVNLTGVFLCGREAALKMVEKGNSGVIVNISSVSKAGNFGQTNYSAAKAGVAAMTVTWAKELAKYNIRCAAVAPGFIATEMTAQMPEAIIEKAKSAVPLKRMGIPEEIASSVNFILENDYFTGRVIETDGGVRI